MKKAFVIHPFFIAIFPILFLFAYNIEQALFFDILLPLVVALGGTLLLFLLSWFFVRDIKKAGVIVAIFLVLFFSYGHVFNLIQGWRIGSFIIGRYRYLMILWLICLIWGVYFIKKTRRQLDNVTKILNIITFSLIAISLINIGVHTFKTRSIQQEGNRFTKHREINVPYPENKDKLRDIYYIILDGYSSSSALKDVYDFDNSEFDDYLIRKGFYIASRSNTNYPISFLSLASSLNMDYVNYLTEMIGIESKDRKAAYQIIKNSKAMNFLKSRGYRFVHFSSGWGATDRNQYADFDYHCGVGNEFLTVLIQTSMLDPFKAYLIKSDARERILRTFSKLAEVHEIEGPKFIFAHIMCPHPPFLFGPNGEDLEDVEFKMIGQFEDEKERFLDQTAFINKKVKILVDEILSQSNPLPIIILQADHGTGVSLNYDDGWNKPTDHMLKERMRIFNAYYLPSGGEGYLYDSISPVNSFRVIFNFYFNRNYEILNDKSYFSNYDYPYRFTDITEIVKYDLEW